MPRKTSVVALLFAGLQISACSDADTPTKIEPATVEHIEGTDLSRVILTPKAAERLGIETVAVREVEVTRKRTPGGEVVPSPAEKVADIGPTWVRVPLNESDLQKVDRSQSALVLAGDDLDAALMATPVEAPAAGDAQQTTGVLYYDVIESAGRELVPGQRVRVETTVVGQRRIAQGRSSLFPDLRRARRNLGVHQPRAPDLRPTSRQCRLHRGRPGGSVGRSTCRH